MCLLSLISSSVLAADITFLLEKQDFSIELRQLENHQILVLDGELRAGSWNHARKVFNHLEAAKDIFFVLNSAGGSKAVHDKFFYRLRNFCKSNKKTCSIETFLHERAKCESSCIKLFQAGDDGKRVACKKSTFGFHAGILSIAGLIKHKVSPEMIMSFYEEGGADSAWLEKNRYLFTKEQITDVSPQNLNGSNIVSVIVNNCSDYFSNKIGH